MHACTEELAKSIAANFPGGLLPYQEFVYILTHLGEPETPWEITFNNCVQELLQKLAKQKIAGAGKQPPKAKLAKNPAR